ncbi:MAG: hypothetical protein JW741_02920 [Sedimentisphaerales bacterium]|nr:hypothetical protein [Sedimentisphaerales bacterium]
MKKFRFLLLDAGPIIKLFELGIWDEFISRCDVTVCRTVAEEARWASQEFEDVCIDVESCGKEGRIHVVDVEVSAAKAFFDRFDFSYKAALYDGEKETLAFLDSSPEPWRVCSSDAAVFRVLGLLGKAEVGVFLEEVLRQIGFGRSLEWKYSEQFRSKYTSSGQTDAVLGKGRADTS